MDKVKKSFLVFLITTVLLLTSGVSVYANTLESYFSLKDVIPNNVVVKDQKKTSACWAFSTLTSLETNLALTNSKNEVYDFSEMHMNYATSRKFLNNKINTYGFNREPSDNGNFIIALAYLTNGIGPVAESDMPYEDTTEEIDISKIQNKTVTAQIYDTIDFPSYKTSDVTEEFKNQIKNHIKKYGAVAASVHGAEIFAEYYNNDTGAWYCDDEEKYPANHAVSIIGWDDNYPVSNFKESHRPTSNGAWIVKNSLGEQIEKDLVEYRTNIKKIYFAAYTDTCTKNGWTQYNDIPDEYADKIITTMTNGTINGDKVYIKVGNNGLMYISYEDVNIYSGLFGIIKASDTVNYDNIYQYNIYGQDAIISTSLSKFYLGNIFSKKTSNNEYLTEVSVHIPETNKCKVYVNLNGTSMKKDNMQAVELKNGETELLEKGYHTLEFAQPLKINSNNFAVVIEFEGKRNGANSFSIEANLPNTMYDVAKIETGKCFYLSEVGFENGTDIADLSKLEEIKPDTYNANSTIKAFTINKVKDDENSNASGNTNNNSTNKNNENKNNSLNLQEINTTTNTISTLGPASVDKTSEIIRPSTTGDNTVATSAIPQTGSKAEISFATILIFGIGIVVYIKYRKLKDIK